jgi:methylenetetrahydrofolate reductase (NADPH)
VAATTMADDLIYIERAWREAGKASNEQVVVFVQTASLEVTQPTPAEVEQIASILPAGTEIFISDVPRRSGEDAASACASISAAGLIPVPHIAVRRIESTAAFERLVADCVERGGARKAMVIAGDYDVPAGPFGDVASALKERALQDSGINEVSVAGYPEGHPRIPAEVLAGSLETKLELLEERGIKQRIVTQFGFDGDASMRFVLRLRGAGVDCPILIGVAGPASAKTLVQFAIRCGVRTAGRFLVRDRQRIDSALFGDESEQLLGQLSGFAAEDGRGDIAPHFFAFGGGVSTARWIGALRDGRLRSV